MTTPSYRGEAALLDWGETRSSGAYVKLQLHPSDVGGSHPFKGMDKGERFAVVIVPFTDEEPVSDRPDWQIPERAEKPKRRWSELSRAQQAGLRCNDAKFRQFLVERCDASDTVECAAQAVRDICDVWSRAHLDPDTQRPQRWDWDPKAAEQWDALNTEFERWAGYLPEDRS